jgi:putative zinc finger/helix-turn-helix YgiT family protein
VDYSVEMDHDGRSYTITIPQLEVLECESCKNRVLTDDAHKRIANALRREASLLTPEEIRASRETLGLTQKQLATYLKVAESTVSRWETGGQIQQRAMDLLLRLFFGLHEVRLALSSGANLAQLGTTVNLHPDSDVLPTKSLVFVSACEKRAKLEIPNSIAASMNCVQFSSAS